jgi:hypothetical protein
VLGELTGVTVVVPRPTVTDRACGVAVLFAVSVTATVKSKVPAVVGVPEIEPDWITDSPGGRVPDDRDHK